MRFAAQLLFCFHLGNPERQSKRILCEQRIAVLEAKSPKMALRRFRRKANEWQYSYVNERGETVRFVFLGIMQLLRLDLLCEDEEVWYFVSEKRITEATLVALVPADEELLALMTNNDHALTRSRRYRRFKPR